MFNIIHNINILQSNKNLPANEAPFMTKELHRKIMKWSKNILNILIFKLADKQIGKSDKTNYKPASILANLSNIYGKLITFWKLFW